MLNSIGDRTVTVILFSAVLIFLMGFIDDKVLAASWSTCGDTIEYADGELLVRFTSVQDSAYVDSVLAIHGCALKLFLPDSVWGVALFDTTEVVDEVCDSLNSLSFIEAAIPHFKISYASAPNDTLCYRQYWLNNDGQDVGPNLHGGKPRADIRILDAWQIEPGSRLVKIAILDSGIPMTGCEVPCCETGVLGWPDLMDTTRIILGRNYIQEGCLPHDYTGPDGGHGTAVASVLASTIDNTFGIAGVIDSCKILVNKPFYQGGSFQYAAFAIREAIDSGVNVVSASWGTPYCKPASDPICVYFNAEQFGLPPKKWTVS